MKRFVLMLIIVLACALCGCQSQNTQSTVEAAEAVVKMPEDDTVNGYRTQEKTESESNTTQSDILYYANKNSKKFHLSTCGFAKRIKAENLYTTTNHDQLLLEGYEPCSNCNP